MFFFLPDPIPVLDPDSNPACSKKDIRLSLICP
jgi:hypothetical protein